MIIGATGYGATGSSVITDFLREFEDVQVFDDFEFSFPYRVDGLQDLEYHVMKQYSKNLSGDAAVKRFLEASRYIYTPLLHKPCSPERYMQIVHKFIDSIVQVKFKGMESVDLISGNIFSNIIKLGMKKKIIPMLIERWTGRASYIWPNREMYVCIKPENFYDAAQTYIEDIIVSMGADLSKPVVLDQPFEGNAPEQSMKFFKAPKAIVIDRDPRDLYLEVKRKGFREGRFFPHEDVKAFTEYYRRLHTQMPKEDGERIIIIRFEDMMYKYEYSVDRIIKFCGLKNHVQKRRFFNPDRSINNTQLIRRFPEEQENIEYIEAHLPEFLYPYEQYPNVKFSGEMLIGSTKYEMNNKIDTSKL